MENVRDRYDAWREAEARELYLFRSGRSSALDLDRIDAEFADVTSGEACAGLASARDAARFADERENYRRLHLAVERAAMSAELRGASRELRQREAAQVARVDGTERSVFEWQARLAAEADADLRRAIEVELERARAELNPPREELFERVGDVYAARGYPTQRAMAEALHPDLDYDAWTERAGDLIARTESVYRDLLGEGLRRIGVAPGRADRGDSARLSALDRYDRWFPPGGARGCLDFTLDGMGAGLASAPGIEVDDEPRPRKHPRASCISVRTPGEVYVLVSPHGGVSDYETLFHEAGHALHAAYTQETLPVERRRNGDPALTEAWAFLLHYRVADRAWIAESPVADRAEVFARDVRFRKLSLLRRYAAKIRFEVELNALGTGESPRPWAERYAEELFQATGFVYRAGDYLADTDPGLYSVDYLRAWCLEAQLSEHLRERFGRRFWREKRGGDLLKELWSTGGTYTPEQLADQLGIGPLGIDALVDDLLSAG